MRSDEASAPALDYWMLRLQPTTLNQSTQRQELQWFIQASQPFRGRKIRVASENLAVHEYESRVLAKAFTDLTGIGVIHDLMPEGKLVEHIQKQMQGGAQEYAAYINDSDFIGTHYRSGKTVVLSDWMVGQGKDVTLPTLDLKDFIGLPFTTGPDGRIYQLPDQQFANLYWFRYDWFTRPELKARFRARYGYELGVPLNWSAYQDIADFFTNQVKVIDGVRIYGHMDYGKADPSLGWRFTDAWLSMAGAASHGYPNGYPIDEWGIRVEGCIPVGASIERGGAVNSPAAVYALQQYLDWLKHYAPPGSDELDFNQAGAVPSKGNIAQQVFWYSAFTKDLLQAEALNNQDGSPKWRMAPSPHGAYWQEGMQRGYQDVGAWTLLENSSLDERKMAWLYAQFTVSKSVSLTKFLAGFTPIRDSDIYSSELTRQAPKLGGLVEFYRSPARISWTPTGINVPDYAALSKLWWPNIALARKGKLSPQQALDSLAREMDNTLSELAREPMQRCGPRLADPRTPQYWFSLKDGPRPRLLDEMPPGKTIDYDLLLRIWQEGGDAK
ncbi:ABC transporter substrate-binding protein [Aeromonas jandaei]|nr:ABC transporter substrate-binding protein [Aeromonas jandaei]